jgi:hypothetical protein
VRPGGHFRKWKGAKNRTPIRLAATALFLQKPPELRSDCIAVTGACRRLCAGGHGQNTDSDGWLLLELYLEGVFGVSWVEQDNFVPIMYH